MIELIRTLWVNPTLETRIETPKDPGDLDIFYATSIAEACAILGQEDYDVILVDLSVTPEPLVVMADLLAAATMPVIALGMEDQAEVGLAAVRNGAADWLSEPEGATVARSLLLANIRDENEARLRRQETDAGQALEEAWVRTGETRLHSVMRGSMEMDDLCNNIVSFLCDYTDLSEGRFYTIEGAGRARLVACVGPLPADISLDLFSLGDSRLGNAARKRHCMMFGEPTPDGEDEQHYYLIAPCVADDEELVGVIELGSSMQLRIQDRRLLEEIAEPVALTVRAARTHFEKQELLTATQKLAHEMQVQQMELKFAFTELEDENRSLEAANERLRLKVESLSQVSADKAVLDGYGQLFGVGDDAVYHAAVIILSALHESMTPSSDAAKLRLVSEVVRKLPALTEALANEFSAIEVEPVMLCEHLKESYQSNAESRNLTFDFKLSQNVPATIHTDSELLHEILGTLIREALEATDSGAVTVVVELAAPDERPAGIDGEMIVFAIEDNRTSHPTESQLSLELLVAAHRAQAIGGWIDRDLSSEEGETFTLYLPTYAEESLAHIAELPASDDRDKLNANDASVLIWTTDETLSTQFYSKCSEAGYRAVVTANFDDLDVFPVPPQFMLVDAEDPHEVPVVIEALRREPMLRAVPLGSFGIPTLELEARRHGAHLFLRLPLQNDEIDAAFNQLAASAATNFARVLIAERGRLLINRLTPCADMLGLELDAVSSFAEVSEMLAESRYTAMVMHGDLGKNNWIEVRRILADEDPYLPVVVYSGPWIEADESKRLDAFAKSAVVRQAQTPSELLDELMLFLPVSPVPASDDLSFLQGRTILLADDDMRNCFPISRALEGAGATVVMAESVEKALEVVAGLERLDLALIDSIMPGLNGMRTIESLRADKRYAELPIVAMIAHNAPEERTRTLDSGASDYLIKPLETEKVVAMLRIWLTPVD